MNKLKLGIISVIVVAGMATLLMMQHQSEIKAREENRSLQEQVDQLAAENESLSNLAAQANSPKLVSNDKLRELVRLRGEVGGLKRQLAEAAKVGEKSAQSPQEEPPLSPEAEQEKQNAMLKMTDAKHFVLVFIMFADDNQGHYPPTLIRLYLYGQI